MNKNLIMIVGALCVVLLIVFWLQYSVVKSLQSATGVDGTSAMPAGSSTSTNVAPAGSGAAASGTQAAPATIGKKTTISAPVHKKH
jgi:hypothetical protein